MFSVGFVADDEPEKPFTYGSSGQAKKPKGILGKAFGAMNASAMAKKNNQLEAKIREQIASKTSMMKIKRPPKKLLAVAPSVPTGIENMIN